MKFPCLVIAKEKHDTRNFIVMTQEGLDKLALQLVEERLEPHYGFYTYKQLEHDNFKDYFESSSDMTLSYYEETIDKLKNSEAIQDKEKWLRMTKNLEDKKRLFNMMKLHDKQLEDAEKAFNEKDAKKALQILRSRSRAGYQYERIDFEEPQIFE